jgi:DNA-binding CsgD family transcriptional regulator
VREAHARIAPLIGGPLARFGEPSPADLPPRARQVLGCVLEGDGDKQIARRLGIRPHTVNQYLKTLFAHFGVRSRPELMARWVRRGWANGFAWADLSH